MSSKLENFPFAVGKWAFGPNTKTWLETYLSEEPFNMGTFKPTMQNYLLWQSLQHTTWLHCKKMSGPRAKVHISSVLSFP